MKQKLLSYSRRKKKIITLSVDFILVLFSCAFTLLISSVNISDLNVYDFSRVLLTPFVITLFFYLFGIYRSVLRFIDFSDVFLLLKALIVSFVFTTLIKLIILYFNSSLFLNFQGHPLSFEGWIVEILMCANLLVGSRIFANYYLSNRKSEKKVVIYGAGSAGIQLARALRGSQEMQPIAFIDNNIAIQKTVVGGMKVLHPNKLQNLVRRNKIDEVLIAMPSASKSSLRLLLKEIEDYSVKVRILPGLAELAQGKILVSELKEVNIEDLLGRLEVDANQTLIDKNIKGKTILVTGAGGSIGSEISKQAVKAGAKKLILLDSSEYALYSIKSEINLTRPKTEIFAILANVTNQLRIESVCRTFEVNTIYHAAAYKHVPLVEENPFEAAFNNIWGTLATSKAAINTGVETFVLISTDKAVRPTNIMGATKRFSELILQALSAKERNKDIKMSMVRFGNVLGSSGSAIPLFQQQIKQGGPITVTHPEVIRYFMSIPEAAELVIQAGAMGDEGDVFVLDMGEPVKILELAKRLVNLSGMEIKDGENPNGEIEIIFTGLRPGEKLFEELLIGNNVSKTIHKQILRAKESFMEWEQLQKYLIEIQQAEKSNNITQLQNIFRDTVSGFNPDSEIVDVVYLQSSKDD